MAKGIKNDKWYMIKIKGMLTKSLGNLEEGVKNIIRTEDGKLEHNKNLGMDFTSHKNCVSGIHSIGCNLSFT